MLWHKLDVGSESRAAAKTERVQGREPFIYTSAYRFPRSMGPNNKNTIATLEDLKKQEQGLKGR